ncbi:MAG: C4-dicarboxylate ABC transporter [Betaproteobacteria bacterium]|nr:MAG: C4-dicarboxylate ABC transporter [Betaproteobacteria bacterium]
MNAATNSRLAHFPVSWFAAVMGISGLALAWRRAEGILGLTDITSLALTFLASALFIAFALIYSAKTLKHRAAVIGEWRHPIRINFVPTVSISLILLSIAWLPLDRDLSFVLWAVGSVVHLGLTLFVMSQWMHRDHFQIQHLNPAWFIPVVGNILVPIAGVEHASIEISWFFFSLGLLFWPVLLAVIMNRVIFHGSLPERLMPTLFILIAPPAVGFISYIKLTGHMDAFAHILYHSGLFFTLLLLTQARQFLRVKFFLSWWAYSFPLAAITVASFVAFEHSGATLFLKIGGVLLALASTVILGIFLRTVTGVIRHEICVEE